MEKIINPPHRFVPKVKPRRRRFVTKKRKAAAGETTPRHFLAFKVVEKGGCFAHEAFTHIYQRTFAQYQLHRTNWRLYWCCWHMRRTSRQDKKDEQDKNSVTVAEMMYSFYIDSPDAFQRFLSTFESQAVVGNDMLIRIPVLLSSKIKTGQGCSACKNNTASQPTAP